MAITDDRTTGRNYPKPVAGNRLTDDVGRIGSFAEMVDEDVTNLILAMGQKSGINHGHSLDQISGLQSALDGKSPTGHNHALAGLSDVSISGAANGMAIIRQGNQWICAAIVIGSISGLAEALTAKLGLDDIAAGTVKPTPVDADSVPLADSAAQGGLKRLTWAHLKAAMATFIEQSFVLRTRTLAANASLNAAIISGFYRLTTGHSNGPGSAFDLGQLIVSRGGDTITQIAFAPGLAQAAFRSGNPLDVGGTGSWTVWTPLMTGNRTVSIAAPSGGADGDVWYRI